MYVSVGIFEIRVPDSQSLKAKRAVVRSVKEKIRRRFSVSVAEVGGQNSWQIARLGVSYVSTDQSAAESQLEKCAKLLEDATGGNLIGWSVETLPFDETVSLGVSADQRLLAELQEEFSDVDR